MIITTVRELRSVITPFTDECPITPIRIEYKHSLPEGGRVTFRTDKDLLDISAIEVVLSRLNAKCEVSQSLIKDARKQFYALKA